MIFYEGPYFQKRHETLTVLNAVRDENAMAMELTLECPTGVKGMNYSRQTNEDKGAWFADDAGYFFGVDMAAKCSRILLPGERCIWYS